MTVLGRSAHRRFSFGVWSEDNDMFESAKDQWDFILKKNVAFVFELTSYTEPILLRYCKRGAKEVVTDRDPDLDVTNLS